MHNRHVCVVCVVVGRAVTSAQKRRTLSCLDAESESEFRFAHEGGVSALVSATAKPAKPVVSAPARKKHPKSTVFSTFGLARKVAI